MAWYDDKSIQVGMVRIMRDECTNEWDAVSKARARMERANATSVNATHDGHVGIVVENGDDFIPIAWVLGFKGTDGYDLYHTLNTCATMGDARAALYDFRLSLRLQWGSS